MKHVHIQLLLTQNKSHCDNMIIYFFQGKCTIGVVFIRNRESLDLCCSSTYDNCAIQDLSSYLVILEDLNTNQYFPILKFFSYKALHNHIYIYIYMN